MINALTGSRTAAVKCIQSKNCLGNVTGISMDSVGPIIATKVTVLILRWG